MMNRLLRPENLLPLLALLLGCAYWVLDEIIESFDATGHISLQHLFSNRHTLVMGTGLLVLCSIIGLVTRLVSRHQKHQHDQNRQMELAYQTVLESGRDMIILRGPAGNVTYATPNCFEMTGYSADEFIADHELIGRLVHPEDQSIWDHHGEIDHPALTLRIITKDGSQRWLNHSCRAIYSPDGTYLGRRGSYRDVTDQVHLEYRLAEEKEFAENLILNSTIPIFVLGNDHTVLLWNRACEDLTGRSAVDMVGTKNHWQAFYATQRPILSDLLIDNDLKSIDHYYESFRPSLYIPDGIQCERWFPEMNGTDRYLLFEAAPIRNGKGELLAVIETLQDITSQKKNEEELHKLTRAVEQSANAVLITDLSGTIEYVNRTFELMTGYKRDEAVGENPRLLKSGNMPPEKYRTLWQTITSGRDWRGELCNKRKNGELYWESATISPIFNAAQEITHFLAIKEDITEKRRADEQLENAYAELKATHQQLLQQEKMASIGQLAAGVAHEINNPMGFIASNLGTLRKYLERCMELMRYHEEQLTTISPEILKECMAKRKELKIDRIMEDAPQLIDESLDGAERVKKIVADLKSFSRVDEADATYADLNQCMESTINIVWNELKYKVTLIRDYGDIPQIQCYPQQLNQVFMNLLINGAHAIADQGEIRVRTWNENSYVNIAVSDTGCGIPPDIIPRIFEPFFTTKEVGKGTGLGLAISYDIIKKHGGDISIDSTVGSGTTFTVRLPLDRGGNHGHAGQDSLC